ncbi:Uncharacterised protein [Mycobacterium tuberculosis]|nr:Uncharacterised protein [Mycobacterium tuberculosis]
MPTEMPIWSRVLLTPDAVPRRRWSGMSTARPPRTGSATPQVNPATIKPAVRWACISATPAPKDASAPATSGPLGIRSISAPAPGPASRIGKTSGRNARPVRSVE